MYILQADVVLKVVARSIILAYICALEECRGFSHQKESTVQRVITSNKTKVLKLLTAMSKILIKNELLVNNWVQLLVPGQSQLVSKNRIEMNQSKNGQVSWEVCNPTQFHCISNFCCLKPLFCSWVSLAHLWKSSHPFSKGLV